MKKISSFFLIAATMLAVSCSKSKDTVVVPPADNTPAKQLVSTRYVYNGGTPETEAITYDSKGRMATYTDDNNTFLFDYQTASFLLVTRKDKASGVVNKTYACDMNAAGAITKILIKSAAGALEYTYDLTYNTDGYITNVKGRYSAASYFEAEFTFVNGNVTTVKDYDNGVFNRTEYYTSDLNKTVKGLLPYWYYWPSATLFGKAPKNPLIENKTIDLAGNTTWHAKSTYQTDAAGYPVKLTTDYILSGTQSVADYVYQ